MGKWNTAGQQGLGGLSSGLSIGMNPALMAATGGTSALIGAGSGVLAGGVMGLIQGSQEEKAQKAIEDQINSMPDFRDSEAYLNAASQASRADRWAQEGMSAQQLNNANQGVGRVAGQTLANAGSLESGLLGQSGTVQSLTDAYTNISMQDAQMKQANRQQAIQAQKNLQLAQEDAFSMDMSKSQNLLDLSLGNLASDRQDAVNTQQNLNTLGQNILNADLSDAKLPFGGGDTTSSPQVNQPSGVVNSTGQQTFGLQAGGFSQGDKGGFANFRVADANKPSPYGGANFDPFASNGVFGLSNSLAGFIPNI